MTNIATHIKNLRKIVSPQTLQEPSDAYLTEWRGRWQGTSPLILAPGNRQELAAIVRFCAQHRLSMTPQGGNTGLVGGQIPQGEILISMSRMNKLRDISPQNNCVIVEAGMTLQTLQEAALKIDRTFPVSIGSEGSCQIGGLISTNAGGINVLRYGNMREQVLGLEVVTPTGEIWDGLYTLRKNNTGYDLKQLFIGAEGTLGFVTAAALKLVPRLPHTATAFICVPSSEKAIELLSFMQTGAAGQISSFELMSHQMLDLVLKHMPDMRFPLGERGPWYILMEIAGNDENLDNLLTDLLSEAASLDLITDATLSHSNAQRAAFWALRHNASEAMRRDPSYCVKCDISVPLHQIPAFLETTDKAVDIYAPGARIIAFGHMGDGNIHYDILAPEKMDFDIFRARGADLERLVHDQAVALGGSIAAEHGIGTLKRDELAQRKSAVEMTMMQAVKKALDPQWLLNPGKVLAPPLPTLDGKKTPSYS